MTDKAKRFLMALDFGTGAGRCFLVDIEGREIFGAYEEWHFNRPQNAQPGGLSFDPDVHWDTLGRAARHAMVKGGVKPEQIAAVSSTALREGFVLLDGEGHEIFAVPNVDARAVTESVEISERLGQEMNDISGHWPSPIMAPARFLWLQRHQPQIVEQAASLLMINDWMLYRLCGERASEPTNAAETCLFDIAELAWDDDLIRACGIPRRIFSPIRQGGQVIGEVNREAAEVTGLAVGTPVVVGGADTQCGVLGTGAFEPGVTVAVAGTSTPNQMIVSSPIIDQQGRTWSGPYVPRDRWVLESNAGSTGTALRWFRDTFCREEKELAARRGVSAYALMEEDARTSDPGSQGVTAAIGPSRMNARDFLVPRFSGFKIENERRITIDRNSKRHFIRAIYESHAFAIRANCEQLEEISGTPIESLIVCGGWSVSDFWMQMVADVIGLDVTRPRMAESSVLGTALCGGVGAGVYASFREGADALTTLAQTFQPNASVHTGYREAYDRWAALRLDN